MLSNKNTIKIIKIVTALAGLFLTQPAGALPPCASSDQIPLSANAFRQLAADRGIISRKELNDFYNNSNLTTAQRRALTIKVNNAVGYGFERFAKKTLQLPLASYNIKTYIRTIRPDSIGTDFIRFKNQLGERIGQCEYDGSVFSEMKAVGDRISLGSYTNQIEAFLVALTNSAAGRAKPSRCIGTTDPKVIPVPRLIFVTVADTILDEVLLERATSEGISVAQQVVCRLPNSDFLQIGPGEVQNPSVYNRTPPPGMRFVQPARIKPGESGLLDPKN